MYRILIIGKNSYVGNSFATYINERYSDEFIIDKISSRNHEWKNHDFGKYNTVFNVSGLCHADARQGSNEDYININGRLPVEIALKAKEEGVAQFVQMSSMIVYGNMSKLGEQKLIKKDTVPESEGIYGESKLMAEKGLKELADDDFRVAIMRPPLIYGENAGDNFMRLAKFALKSPLFPNIDNSQSMIYIDNFCELVRLVIVNGDSGIFCPQDKKYINTSRLVNDIAISAGKRIKLVKCFNPILKIASKKVNFINKAFGNLTYDFDLSSYYDWKYNIVSYKEAVGRISKKYSGADNEKSTIYC